MRRLLIVGVLTAGCASAEFQIRGRTTAEVQPLPAVTVSPTHLDFGEVSSRVPAPPLPFRVTNTGEADLFVDRLVVDFGEGFTLLTRVDDRNLAPGDSVQVDVAFSPAHPFVADGQITVHSDDPENPEARVTLSGRGSSPLLVIDPPTLDLGEVTLPCEASGTLTLRNDGGEDLLVESVSIEGVAVELVDVPELPVLLPPGIETVVSVTFAPDAVGAGWGELAVISDDPAGVKTASIAGEASMLPSMVQSFTAEETQAVDILFAVDQSCSMSDDRRRLALGVDTFIDTFGDVVPDWQIGVVTEDHGCFNGGLITQDTPDYQTAFADAVDGPGGMYGWLTEALLELSAVAMEKALGGCNNGFLRGNPVHVIVVSDEPEQSGSPMSQLDRMLAAAMPGALVVSGVVAESCGDPAGYAEAIASTGGLQIDLCDEDWGSLVDELALRSLAVTNSLVLDADPIPWTIEVRVNGEVIPDFRLDQGIVFVLRPLLEGDLVEVSYVPWAECP